VGRERVEVAAHLSLQGALEAAIYRSSDVWEAIKGNIIAFVGKWHVSSRVAACLTAIDELRDDYGSG
jgi:hypothetical protein